MYVVSSVTRPAGIAPNKAHHEKRHTTWPGSALCYHQLIEFLSSIPPLSHLGVLALRCLTGGTLTLNRREGSDGHPLLSGERLPHPRVPSPMSPAPECAPWTVLLLSTRPHVPLESASDTAGRVLLFDPRSATLNENEQQDDRENSSDYPDDGYVVHVMNPLFY
jgi:hypothetical protein